MKLVAIAFAFLPFASVVLSACGGSVDDASLDASVEASVGGDAAPFADVGAPNRDGGSQGSRDGSLTNIDAGGASDAALDVAELAPCQPGGYVFYVDGENGYSGISGPMKITDADGTWSAELVSGSVMILKVAGIAAWGLTASSDFTHGSYIAPGTYPSTGSNTGSWMQVQADGGGCNGLPTGAFTIVDVQSTGGDQATVTKLAMWFELTCNDAGALRGCVRYGY